MRPRRSRCKYCGRKLQFDNVFGFACDTRQCLWWRTVGRKLNRCIFDRLCQLLEQPDPRTHRSLELREVLWFYDIPQLFTAIDTHAKQYICILMREAETGPVYACGHVHATDLALFKLDTKSLPDLLQTVCSPAFRLNEIPQTGVRMQATADSSICMVDLYPGTSSFGK